MCDSIEKLVCKRCGYSWFPRTPTKPKHCSKCNSPYWDRNRIKSVVKDNEV